MGYRSYIPNAGLFRLRNDDNGVFFSSIHRATVKDVNTTSGSIKVHLEGIRYEAEIPIPVLGLSIKPTTDNRVDPNTASWGRYIPQIGDTVLVGFGPNGDLYPISNTYSNYTFFASADQDMKNQNKGGIGWSQVSRADVQSGDWDFKSSRNSSFYLGDRARMASGASSFTAHATEIKATVASPLVELSSGYSTLRVGTARRQNLPTDGSESFVVGATGPLPPQEFDLNMRPLIPTVPPAPLPSLARLSVGEVIDSSTKHLMISPLAPAALVRYYMSVFDSTYFLPAYEIVVDTLGNKKEEALTGTFMTWNTPLATWDITNLETKITSASIKLGGDSAVFSLVLGETLKNSLQLFCTMISGAFTTATANPNPSDVAATSASFKAYAGLLEAAAKLLNTSLDSVLSMVSKTA